MSTALAAIADTPSWVTINDRISNYHSVNLAYVQDVDWKPGIVILWFCNGDGIEVADTHPQYGYILTWLREHGFEVK